MILRPLERHFAQIIHRLRIAPVLVLRRHGVEGAYGHGTLWFTFGRGRIPSHDDSNLHRKTVREHAPYLSRPVKGSLHRPDPFASVNVPPESACTPLPFKYTDGFPLVAR